MHSKNLLITRLIKKIGAIAGLSLVLSGCGWRPLYKVHANTEAMGRIQVAHISGRDGQILRGFLLENLHMFKADQNQNPLYTLKVTFSPSVQTIGYNAQATALRTEEEGTVSLELQDNTTRKIFMSDTLTGSYSYPVSTQNPHTTCLSQERRYLLEYLSHRIVTRVAQALENAQ